MITKAQVKEIRALATAKGRNEHGSFLVEGDKLCREWLHSENQLETIVGVEDWLDKNQELILRHPEANIIPVSEDELAKISTLQNPNLALVTSKILTPKGSIYNNEWCLALDTLQDPGNLGTIIRIADWFGINQVICSTGCADFYNPKVVSAAMGGHLRVNLHVASLPEFLQNCNKPIFAATLNGASIQECLNVEAAVLIIGNESKGISEPVLNFATKQITIPRKGGAESLNAAVATGILLALLLPG